MVYKRIIAGTAIIAACAGIWWIVSVRTRPLQEQTRYLMDTYVTIKAAGRAGLTRAAINKALDRMQEIDVKMNCLNPASPLYAFNEKGTPVDDAEIVDLVARGLEVSRRSGGAFDMTLLPLTRAWGFDTKTPRRPTDSEIARARSKTGYQYLVIEDGRLRKTRPYIAVDLGGIAKGYAVGEAVKVLKRHGISSAIIDAGGNIYVIGTRGGRHPWKVGIKAPRGDGMLGYMELTDMSVSCSGDYERYFIDRGTRYHHVFDARTGFPADSGVISATVIYDDCAMTDAWTKVLFVLGGEQGMKLIEDNPGMEAIAVAADGTKTYSRGLRSRLKNIETE